MYYVYILQSKKDRGYYIGYTKGVDSRVVRHNSGRVKSTVCRKPFKLIWYEEVKDKRLAIKREREIKSYKGGNAFKRLISESGAVG